jgi:hypothetical protein
MQVYGDVCQICFSIDEIDLDLDEEEVSDDDHEESEPVSGVSGM